MLFFNIDQVLLPASAPPGEDRPYAVLLRSEELSQLPKLPGLERMLHHTPAARDARVCKAEVRRDCLCGTVVLPRRTRDGAPIALGYLLNARQLVLVDDSGALPTHLRALCKEQLWMDQSVGRLLCALLERLLERDLHHLEELELQAEGLEDQVLQGGLDAFNAPMAAIRKEAMAWFRCYSQLSEVAARLRENENGFFREQEQRLFRLLEERVMRLREEAQLLREYCLQIQTLFQAEIDIRQNRIMKILTIVTTIVLPLSLLVGWYGMNFVGMPELTWRFGYPAVIALSLAIIAVSLWICKKKKFW